MKTQKPDTQLTQEHSVESQARDSDSNGKVCAPSDSSDFITQCNDSNPSGEEPEGEAITCTVEHEGQLVFMQFSAIYSYSRQPPMEWYICVSLRDSLCRLLC